MDKLHGRNRFNGEVIDPSINGIIVDVENNVFAPQVITPTEYRIDDGKHLFDLYVLVSEALWAASREPMGSKVTSQSFGPTSVCVNVENIAFGGYEANSIPMCSKSKPPCDVTTGCFGDVSSREFRSKLSGKIIQPSNVRA